MRKNVIFMFRIRAVMLVLALCLFPLGNSANAVLVELEGSAEQKEAGQSFTFSFFPAAHSNANDATLTIRARGDYSIDNEDEFLSWSIDGVASGTASPKLGATVTDDVQSNYVEWESTFTVSAEDMSVITSDSGVEITVDLTPDVNILSWRAEYVEVALAYVPEPATLLLLGGGSLLLLTGRKRRA